MLFDELGDNLRTADRVAMNEQHNIALELLPAETLGHNNNGLVQLAKLQRIGKP